MRQRRFVARVPLVAFIAAACGPTCATPTPDDVLVTLKRVAEVTPLTDARMVLDALGVNAPLEVTLLRDHVRVSVRPEALLDTPYRNIGHTPFVGAKPASEYSYTRPDRSTLSIWLKTETCITKDDVIRVFGSSFEAAPLVMTDGESGTRMTYLVQRPEDKAAIVTFSFRQPVQCAESFFVNARFRPQIR